MTSESLLGQDLVRETYEPGQYIFFEGDHQAHFYIVEKGEVLIFTMNANGEKIDIANVIEGEQFGEFALLDNAPRSASALAVKSCTLIKVSEEGYNHLLNELPPWATSMMKTLVVRLKHLNNLLKSQPQFFDSETTRGSYKKS